jgi:hypothetical protein
LIKVIRMTKEKNSRCVARLNFPRVKGAVETTLANKGADKTTLTNDELPLFRRHPSCLYASGHFDPEELRELLSSLKVATAERGVTATVVAEKRGTFAGYGPRTNATGTLLSFKRTGSLVKQTLEPTLAELKRGAKLPPLSRR